MSEVLILEDSAKLIAHFHVHITNNVKKKAAELEFCMMIPRQRLQALGSGRVKPTAASAAPLRLPECGRATEREQGGADGEA